MTSTIEMGSRRQPWCYIDRLTRGHARGFSGQVDYIHGAAADRLRGELGLVISELLIWAGDESARRTARDDDQE
ncbi:hypothetical protein [Amycolatopsis benzoatilytica]|uniref:hypothetical protein n=1 Tax=Amycolatopsis benzoatilytica TaxID=346045 RepID=UPI0012B6869F|nr:hypothetical protein [Amycolatopsis benzoatilytica]